MADVQDHPVDPGNFGPIDECVFEELREAIIKAEQERLAREDADPAVRREREQRDAEVDAIYRWRHGIDARDFRRREKFMRDAWYYGALCLACALDGFQLPPSAKKTDVAVLCDQLRDLIVMKVHNEFVASRKKEFEKFFRLAQFDVLLWEGDNPSLADTARAAILGRIAPSLAEGKAEGRRPKTEIARWRKELGLGMKDAGEPHHAIAKVLYNKRHPTDGEVNCVSSILRHFRKTLSNESVLPTQKHPRK
jgi:hypothetical protein